MSFTTPNCIKINILRILVSTLAVMSQAATTSAAVDISACTTISAPGEYRLIQDLQLPPPPNPNSTFPNDCIGIVSSDVVLDGAGFTINGSQRPGVYAYNVTTYTSGLTNVTVKNLIITNLIFGIEFSYVSNGSIINNTMRSTQYGLLLQGSDNISITDNNVSLNWFGVDIENSNNSHITGNRVTSSSYGIIFYEATGNLIFNNYFNNTVNARDYTGGNIWNITGTPQLNIFGGPYLGGNFWSDYSGNDTDGDGLGDTLLPYTIYNLTTGPRGFDYLPLTAERVIGTVPSGGTVTTDPTGSGPVASDPMETSVTTPVGGTVTIEETSATQQAPVGYFLIGNEIVITAPDSTNTSPLVINFTVDAVLIPTGQPDLDAIVVYRNGVPVMNCIASNPINPDPCIFGREVIPASGDGRITVYTSQASTWGLFKPSPAQKISDLIVEVESLNLQKGIDNSLDAKLEAARKALQDARTGNDGAATNPLEAFKNAVMAQRGKEIPEGAADALVAAAQSIIQELTGA